VALTFYYMVRGKSKSKIIFWGFKSCNNSGINRIDERGNDKMNLPL